MPNPVDLEPQAKAVVDANANPPYLFELGPDQGRRTIDAVQSGPVKKLVVDIEDTTVPGGPSGQVSVRILRPQGARRPLPVIVHLHGAGWVFGNHHTHDRLIRELAVGAQAAVVFPNYSRSPEAKWGCCVTARRDTLEPRPPPGSDGQRQLVERGGHPPIRRLLSGQLVVSAPDVLHERMPHDDDPGTGVLLEAAHRP